MKPFRTLVAIAALLSSTVPVAAWAQGAGEEPSSQEMDEARARYERGIELYNDGDYEQALIEFDRAYNLAPAYSILFNIGQAAYLLKDYPRAVRAFEQYLEDGAEKIPKDRRDAVEKDLDNLRARTATLRIETNLDGVKILVDEVPMGTTPLSEPLLVNAGMHTITARKTGAVTETVTVTLAGKDDQTVTLDLELLPAGTSNDDGDVVVGPALPPPPPEENYVWVGWVATGVLTAGAIGMGIGTLAADSNLEDLKGEVNDQSPADKKQELEDANSQRAAFALITDVLIGAAAVTGAVSLYFSVAGSDDSTTGSAGVVVTPSSLSFQGTF